MQQRQLNINLTSRHYLSIVLLICAGYLGFQLYFIPHEILTADEFVFARHIYEYTFHLPYRDFAPYKTVLGYYLLSIPFYFSHSLLAPLFYLKDEIAIINTIAMLISSYWAMQLFDKKVVLLTLLMMIANQHFLIYSSELRVDMLTSWFCLFAVLALLRPSLCLAGLLLSIAFLISQKALWYWIAMNGGMLLCFITPLSAKYTLRSIIRFNVWFVIPIIIYVTGWSLIASPQLVFYNLFYEGYIQSTINWYLPIYFICWKTMLLAGPLLFISWPITFFSLNDKSFDAITLQRHIFIIGMSTITLMLFISYKQAFPYNFVLLFPALFLLFTNFLSWIFTRQWHTTFILSLFIVAGFIYPFFQTIFTITKLDGDYQQTMLALIDELTHDGSDYAGGIPYLYYHDQPINGFKNLIGPQIAYFADPNANIKSLLLPSIYLSPTTYQQIITDFENLPIKIVVDSYRIMELPPIIKNYLATHYSRFYGSIYLYSPTISLQQNAFDLKFTGNYRVRSASLSSIFIDNQKLKSGAIIHLQKGLHHTRTHAIYRLDLIPALDKSTFNPAYTADFWLGMTKAILI